MFSTYILKSLNTGRHYVGHCQNLESRLARHNNGLVRSTKGCRPWRIVYEEKFATKPEAFRREFQIKSYKGGNEFKKLLRADTEAVKRG